MARPRLDHWFAPLRRILRRAVGAPVEADRAASEGAEENPVEDAAEDAGPPTDPTGATGPVDDPSVDLADPAPPEPVPAEPAPGPPEPVPTAVEPDEALCREAIDELALLYGEWAEREGDLDGGAGEYCRYVCRSLVPIFEAAGLTPIDTDGPFDRNRHEPVASTSGIASHDTGWTAAIVWPGFARGTRILVRARVTLTRVESEDARDSGGTE